MLSKIAIGLTGLLTLVAADTLPMTLVISVIDSTGTVLGSLNGYGNFSSPGPDYPFFSRVSSGEDSTVSGYGLCSVIGTPGVLACNVTDPAGSTAFTESNGNFILDGTDGTWSVDNTTDAAGGTNPFGLPNGIPVYLGDTAAIPVTLSVHAASG